MWHLVDLFIWLNCFVMSNCVQTQQEVNFKGSVRLCIRTSWKCLAHGCIIRKVIHHFTDIVFQWLCVKKKKKKNEILHSLATMSDGLHSTVLLVGGWFNLNKRFARICELSEFSINIHRRKQKRLQGMNWKNRSCWWVLSKGLFSLLALSQWCQHVYIKVTITFYNEMQVWKRWLF